MKLEPSKFCLTADELMQLFMTYIIHLKTAVDGNLRVLDAEQLLQIDLHLVEHKCTEERSSPELSCSFHKQQSGVSVPPHMVHLYTSDQLSPSVYEPFKLDIRVPSTLATVSNSFYTPPPGQRGEGGGRYVGNAMETKLQ